MPRDLNKRYTPTAEIGGATNYSEFEADGTLKFVGNATVWEDLRVPLETARTQGSLNLPVYTKVMANGGTSPGVYLWVFEDSDQIFFSVQMPHGWKTASTIYPHVHWMPLTDSSPAANTSFGLEYTWVDIGEDMGNTTKAEVTVSTGENNQYRHTLTAVPATGIAGTDHTLSSMILCRLYRKAAASTNYADDIAVLEFDVHYEIDTVGSREVTSK